MNLRNIEQTCEAIDPHGVHRSIIIDMRNAILAGDDLGPIDREDLVKILNHEIERLYLQQHPNIWKARLAY